ncbi:MAG: hypothetical protein R2939_13405, partial [Kofleriaceae bacterium]
MRRLLLCVAALAAGCGEAASTCDPAPAPFRASLGCEAEFETLAARPLDAALPGAMTIKTIVDRAQDDAPFFLDTMQYPLHAAFAREHLGYPPGAPFVDEYFAPQRRLLLGSITYYEEPAIWAYELAPYDTASAELITEAFRVLAGASYFGAALRFHPTSEEQAARAAELPDDVGVVTTAELFAGITYQPLNLGETYARVRLLTAAQLETTYVSPRELAVLDRVPNDLAVVAGVVTAEFQTPLSHVNVLSQQRGTPNMALRDAAAAFAGLDGRWVRLTVGAFAWEVEEVSADLAEAWWQDHRPTPVTVTPPDLSVTALLDVDDVGPADVATVGGKAANYGALRQLGGPVRVRPALVIPVAHYVQFLAATGLDAQIAAMLVDDDFRADGLARAAQLAALRDAIRAAPLDPDLLAAVEARLEL